MTVVPIDEYRKLMNDQISSDEQILKRSGYLEALCRSVIREELGKLVNSEQSNLSC